MVVTRYIRAVLAVGALLVLSGCGGGGLGSIGGIFGGSAPTIAASEDIVVPNATAGTPPPAQQVGAAQPARRGLFSGEPAQQVDGDHPPRRSNIGFSPDGVFGPGGLFGRARIDPNTEIQVNKYLWNASLEVLSFLPLQSADPFTGVIVTGFGTPPGGGRAYRATIFIRDPALDARSLTISLSTRGGAASTQTIRAVEDAILTRARQLRVGDGGL